MRQMIKWLISDFSIRAFVAAIIGLTILTVAGFIESGNIRWSSLIRRSVPYGACFGSMWTIIRWRKLSGDILISNRGEPPIMYYSILFCLASMLCVSSISAVQPITSSEVKSVTPGQTLEFGETVFKWSNGQLTRQHADTPQAIFEHFPKPPTIAASASSYLTLRMVIWPMCLIALFTSLCLPKREPSVGFGLLSSTICVAGGEICLRLF